MMQVSVRETTGYSDRNASIDSGRLTRRGSGRFRPTCEPVLANARAQLATPERIRSSGPFSKTRASLARPVDRDRAQDK